MNSCSPISDSKTVESSIPLTRRTNSITKTLTLKKVAPSSSMILVHTICKMNLVIKQGKNDDENPVVVLDSGDDVDPMDLTRYSEVVSNRCRSPAVEGKKHIQVYVSKMFTH